MKKDEIVVILSGEGEIGTYERYKGELTDQAIKSRLKKERQGGDRWAKAYILMYDDVYCDYEDTSELKHIDIDEIE